MSKYLLFVTVFVLLFTKNAWADKNLCLEQCEAINKNCISKCLNPHPTYQSCKEACNANRYMCITQCKGYGDTQKKIEEMDRQKGH